LFDYFPQRMRETYRAQIEQHPLRREIVVTQVVNEVVNGAGMTFWPRLAGETGLAVDELVRAHFAAREIFGAQEMRAELATWDNKLPAALQTRMRLEVRTLIERATRWLGTNHRGALDPGALVERYQPVVTKVLADLPGL